jgi:hypothetical protein
MGNNGVNNAWYNLYGVDLPRLSGGTLGKMLGHFVYNIMPSGAGEIISGRITDSIGYAIPWATVTAEGHGGPYTTTTNARGIYALIHVHSNTDYSITVQKQGFTFPVRTIRTGESDYKMEPGNRWGIDFVGSFTGLAVDDFEAYDDTGSKIEESWTDGRDDPLNGAIIGYDGPNRVWREHTIETVMVNAGAGSMPYFYDTNHRSTEATLRMGSLSDWTVQDVRVLSLWFRSHSPPAGTFIFTGGKGQGYEMTAAGADIGNRSDECHFAYKRLRGPGSIEVNIQRIEENSHEWAKAGVMIRETLDPGAKFAGVFTTASHGCIFQARMDVSMEAMSDDLLATSQQQAMSGNAWLRLERDENDNFYGYYSEVAPAHNAWQPMSWNPLHIPMADEVYIGMATTSHDPYRTAQAVFAWPETYGDDDPAWTSRDIGIIHNVAAPMYVAVKDSAGRSASIFHNHIRATLADTWTQWTIDLREFSSQGVNLADVETLSIGFGTGQTGAETGATGLMFFDDIHLETFTGNLSSINLQATSGPACIDLTWCQYGVDLFAGFNLYRATEPEPNGVFTRLNSTILSVDQDSFRDVDVQPNTTYYYKCAVVTNDMTESDYSNTISTMPLEVNPPEIQHEPIVSDEPGTTVTFSAVVTDETDVKSVSLLFRRIGQAEYQRRSMVLIYHNRYSVTLESAWNQVPGLEYYIEATDGLSTATCGSAISPYCLANIPEGQEPDIIGNWEYRMDGWSQTDWSDTTFFYNDTVGVTRGDYSLEAHVPQGGWKQIMQIDIVQLDRAQEFARNDTISLDVTHLAADWPIVPAPQWGSVAIWLNAEGVGWTLSESLGGAAPWVPGDGDVTQTAVWSYAEHLAQIDFDNLSSLELVVISNCDEDYPGEVTLYLDNMQLSATEHGIIGNWEYRMDGWSRTNWSDTTFFYNDTVGVTRGNYSLEAHVPQSGWKYIMQIDLVQVGFAQEFARNDTISLDVTRLAADWLTIPAPEWSDVKIWMNAEGAGWNLSEPLGGAASWVPGHGDVTQTAVWSYAEHLTQIDFHNLSRLQLVLISSCDEDYPGEVTLYLDNMELSTTEYASDQ